MTTRIETTSERQRTAKPESRRWRRVISVLLLFHLATVLVGPLAFSTQFRPGEPSIAAELAMDFFRRFSHIDFADLNHGYFFFAPTPGPSHLITYRAYTTDSAEPIVQTFPDLNRQWPRLLYHRHFMLSEQLNGSFAPQQVPPQVASNPVLRANWERQRKVYNDLWSSYENHLKHTYDATAVEMERVEHRLPWPYDVLQGMKLDDKSLYVPFGKDALPGDMP